MIALMAILIGLLGLVGLPVIVRSRVAERRQREEHIWKLEQQRWEETISQREVERRHNERQRQRQLWPTSQGQQQVHRGLGISGYGYNKCDTSLDTTELKHQLWSHAITDVSHDHTHRINSDAQLSQLRSVGRGMIFTRDSGVLHRASCPTLAQANGRRKEWFPNESEAIAWLRRSRPWGWRRCPFCL